ncbi:hypothetical protein [Carboxylicivirga sp. RSCT41]|uniref:hypothetical protein n=1 Tax=Carboxylicivirga agarovorans TaxID=3417570 RepID=UPI003D337457
MIHVNSAIEANNRELWEIARIQAYHTVLPHIDSKKIKNFTPQKFMPFEWDKYNKRLQEVVKKIELSREEKLKIMHRLTSAKSTGEVFNF